MNRNTSHHRRDFLHWGVSGLGATALVDLLQSDGRAMGHAPARVVIPRAKRAIQICLIGGLSHVDSFDYKPGLADRHGKSLGTTEAPAIFFGRVGLLRKNDWKFRQRGNSGLWASDMFPHISGLMDDLTVVRSMVTESANHTPALFFENSGFEFNGFPSLGSWLSFGLGSETENLPAYVVLPDGRGGPNGGASNWSNGFLPSQHQGVVFRSKYEAGADTQTHPVRDLFPARNTSAEAEQDIQRFLAEVHSQSRERGGGDPILEARMRSYSLAAKMQLSVPEVSDLSQEPQRMLDAYGLDRAETADCGSRCLLGRRLLERGVRFVQIYSGGPISGEPRLSWDAHEDVVKNHTNQATLIDQPVAALVQDLKQRGMLDDTLVLFTTEFGRTPFTQADADKVGKGRDHNRYGFSIWMAGAGLVPGMAYGATDELGWKSVEHPTTWHDLHATILHLLGLDHERLTYYHNGIQRRLTNVHGEVIRGILA